MSTIELQNAVFRETKTTINLSSFEEDSAALVALISQTKSEINIYSHILCPPIFNTETTLLAFEQFCLKNHRTKINILVNESQPITRISHRLLGLSHRHSSSIFFKKINPVIPSRNDDFVCFDKSAYFQLPNYQHYAGTCNFADAGQNTRFMGFFADAWDRSEPDAEFRSVML
ncbi:MAG: GNAT family acetyltransferase [Cycloclasticus sp. symbiont of Bathymodiolus heckerae]|nr:MAG: GNAT family acetyltransferase [Cycloclasticus sp. symbiont of Bathymodiolus heckerae]